MEEPIAFAQINDFIFCPASIYFHGMYEGVEELLYKAAPQLNGTQAHRNIDSGTNYSENVISGMFVYSEEFNIVGKIDKYFLKEQRLVECKRKIEHVYDGYIYQLYAQYFGMIEAGHTVAEISLYDITSHKKYPISLPQQDFVMFEKFKNTLAEMRLFDIADFVQTNVVKCQNCIYSNICSRSLS